jgi:hypothetical protein
MAETLKTQLEGYEDSKQDLKQSTEQQITEKKIKFQCILSRSFKTEAKQEGDENKSKNIALWADIEAQIRSDDVVAVVSPLPSPSPPGETTPKTTKYPRSEHHNQMA